MNVILFVASALFAYLIGGANGAIVMSKLVYHKDIRDYGSKNPGFTNFKRVFGMNFATVLVFFFDILKTVIAVWLFAFIFEAQYGLWNFGAAYTGFFCMLGHAYPVWYGFRGGKTFMTWATSIWFVDWRISIIAIAIFLILLFTVKIMSLSSMSAAAIFAILFAILGEIVHPDLCEYENYIRIIIKIIPAISASLLIYRHKENIGRIIRKEEKKFSLFSRKPSVSTDEPTQQPNEEKAEENQEELVTK